MVTFSGRLLQLNYPHNPRNNVLLERIKYNDWAVLEAKGDNISGRVLPEALGALEALYTKYINDVIMLEMT